MTCPCSGLHSSNSACERRHQCANCRHWPDDPRSELGQSPSENTAINLLTSMAAGMPLLTVKEQV